MRKKLFSCMGALLALSMFLAQMIPLNALPTAPDGWQETERPQIQSQRLNNNVFTGSFGFYEMNGNAFAPLITGSTCSDPIQISAIPFSDPSKNTSAFGNNVTSIPPLAPGAYQNGTSYTYYHSGDDAVYAITPSINGQMTVSITGVGTYTGLFVMTGCPLSSTVGFHVNSAAGSRTIPNLPVVAGTTYYIVISTWATPQSTAYSLSVDGTPGLLAPPPSCSGEPVPGTIAVNPSTGGPNSTYTVSATGYPFASDLSFQWYSSIDNGLNWSFEGNPTEDYAPYTATAPGNVGAKVLWQLVVTCLNSFEFGYSNIVEFEVIDVYSNNNGNLPTLYSGSPTVNTVGCAGPPDPTITITVPNGKRIASLNTQYSMTALGGGWMSEQRSYIYSTSLNAGESTMSSGSGSTGGTFNYNRTLTFANGETGTVTFELRSFRTYGSSGCNTTYQYINNGTWKLLPVYEDIPSCADPSQLAAGNITETSADISWTGNANSYDLEYGIAGFTQGQGTLINDASSPYSITGLTENVLYDVYVRSNCGNNDYSPWKKISFKTGYCEVTSTSINYGISKFQTTGGITNIDKSSAGGSYSNYTDLSVSQQAGSTVNFSITSANSTAGMAIWIDWNKNMVFDDAEKVYNAGSYVSTGTGTITVPGSQPEGNYRMRVVANYLTTSPTACGDLGYQAYGEAEDYTFSVVVLNECSGAPDGGTASVNPVSGGSNTTYQVSAAGFDPGLLSVTYRWEYSTDQGSNWTSVGDFGSYANYTATAPENTSEVWWRLAVYCGNSQETGYSSTAIFTVQNPEPPDGDGCTRVTPTHQGGIENGTGNLYTLEFANDIVVEKNQTFSVDQLRLNILHGLNETITTANIKFYDNNNGSPGNQIASFTNVGLNTRYYVGQAFGFDDYSYVYNLPSVVNLVGDNIGPKVFWVSVKMNNGSNTIYWESTTTLNTPNPMKSYQNDTWVSTSPAADGVMKLFGECSYAEVCDGAPTQPTVMVSPATENINAEYIVSASGYDSVGGLSFQWQSSTDNSTWTDQGDATPDYADYYATAPGQYGETVYWRLAITCTDTQETTYSESATFTTVITYCSPTTTGGGGTYYISNFTTTGGSANINNTSSSSVIGYTDFTGVGGLTANQGDVINYSMAVAGGSNYGRAIWIDFNQNGSFEATEQVVSSSTYEYPPLTGNFAIPGNAIPGTTRMRILASYSPSNPSNPCTNSGTGEYEDYSITITVPMCSLPSGLQISNNTGTSATLSWTDASPIPSDGYDYYLSTVNTPPIENTTPSGNVSGTSVDFNPLTIETNYYVWVRSNCGNGSYSNWTGISFRTGYCEVTSTNTTYGIGRFQTSGGITNIDKSSGPGTYNNYTNLAVSQQAGGLVGFTITTVTADAGMGIWIDWNNNMSFEPGEKVYASGGYLVTGTGTITVPSGQPEGNYRMRVVANYIAATPTACGDLGYQGYGEAEDYTFSVIVMEACSEANAGTPLENNPDLVCLGKPFTIGVSGASEPALGLTRNWEVSTDQGSTWTAVPNSDTPSLSVNGIQSETYYRFVVTCENNTNYSDNIVVNINPDPAACYCIPSSTSTYYTTSFLTTGGVDNINNSVGSVPPNGYGDFTNMVVSQYNNMSVNFSTSNNSTAGVRIWVDWNHNGVFDATEVVYQSSSYLATQIGTIAVPMDALLGTTRMRVGLHWLNQAGPSDPCTNNGSPTYVSFQDYTFNVLQLAECSEANAGTPVETQMSVCPNSPFTVSVTGASDPADGLTRVWQYYDSVEDIWVDIQGANDPSESFTTTEPGKVRYAVSCSYSEETNYSDEIQISLKPANQCHCVPTTTGAGTYYISNFTTTGGSANINNTSGSSVSGYTDFRNSGSLSVSPGDQIGYSMSVAGGSNYGRAIWIDFNQNGSFEAGEQVVTSSSYEYPPLTGTFNIPNDAAYGTTVMRILASYTPSNPSNPCTNTGSGEYEDYTIVITPGDNIWENGYWSYGIPTNVNLPHRKLIFRSDFTSQKNGVGKNTNGYGRIWGTSAVVEAGVSVVFETDYSLVLEDELIVDSDNGASATFKSGASLGQKNPNAVNQGIVDFERNFNISESGDQYNLVISPVLDFDIQNVYPGSPLVYKLNESTNGFVNDGVGTYVPGKGFRLDEAGSAGSLTGVFTGIPANGNVNFPVTANGSGMNLTGNPYPSILLLDRFYASNLSKITPSFYFWDNRGYTNQNSVLYQVAVYNAASQTGTAAMGPVFAGYDERIPNGEVSVANGFAVQATQAGTLKFRNTQRLKVDSDEPEFFGKSAAKDRYWLTMTTPDKMQAMTAVVYFGEGNNGVGIEDSKSVQGNEIIYTLVNDDQLVIQGKAPFSSSDVVPMGVKVTTNGKHTIALLKQEGVFENGQIVYLRDKATGAVHNLSQSAYQFTATVGQYNNRFEIIYNGFTDLMASTGIKIEKKDHNIVVSSTDKIITGVEIFNLAGLPVYSKSDLNTQIHSVPVNLMPNQIVVVSVKTDTGEIVNKKFVNQQ